MAIMVLAMQPCAARFSVNLSMAGLALGSPQGAGAVVEPLSLWSVGWQWSQWAVHLEGPVNPLLRGESEGSLSLLRETSYYGLWWRRNFEETLTDKSFFRMGLQQENLALRQQIGQEVVQSADHNYFVGWGLGWGRWSRTNWELQVEVRQLFPVVTKSRDLDLRWMFILGWGYHI